jgi:3-hydroxyisobutyrate dehydrogenase-like beta-hydroxyacid dehydrogenase
MSAANSASSEIVGIVGLGIMGGAFCRHLIAAGRTVVGCDPDPAARERAQSMGARVVADAAAVAESAEIVLVVVPSPAALGDVVNRIVASAARARTVVEMGTFDLDTKLDAAQRLAAAGHTMLDCPVSGTGAQARTKDIVVFVSGDSASAEAVRPVFTQFARQAEHVGPLGNGTKMKLVTNHLVAIHVAAAGEAIALGIKSGLDPQQVLDMAMAGAADSRMLHLRGPMMVANRYDGPEISARTSILMKDCATISSFADTLSCPTPVLNAVKTLFAAAMATGHADHDPASVAAVSRAMAGVEQTDDT